MKYKSLVITGPSGSGKSTIIEKILKTNLFRLSVSYTTRLPRENEINGKNYVFVSREEFNRKIEEGFFLEYAEFGGNLYGTPLKQIENGKIVIFDIEIKGVEFFKKNLPNEFFCLVKIERDIMKKRLYERMMNEKSFDAEEFERRMKSFDFFEKFEKNFNFNKIIDNSKGLAETNRQIEDLIQELKY